MPDPSPLIGAIEAGGTKFVCGAGRSWQEVRSGPKHRVETTTPAETMAAVTAWLAGTGAGGPVEAIGVASFGPLDLDEGRIAGSTPKRAWAGFDWRASLAEAFPAVPVALDTDTQGAALAESVWGAGRDRRVVVYVTVGTGIGGGVIVDGAPLPGLARPELGHMRVPRLAADPFDGVCPYHGDCLEGLACGAAVEARWGQRGETLPGDHPAWAMESEYLASAVVNITLTLSPQVIILGGGVMKIPGLMEATRSRAGAMLAGYVPAPPGFVTGPGLDPDSGLLGAFALARTALALPLD